LNAIIDLRDFELDMKSEVLKWLKTYQCWQMWSCSIFIIALSECHRELAAPIIYVICNAVFLYSSL